VDVQSVDTAKLLFLFCLHVILRQLYSTLHDETRYWLLYTASWCKNTRYEPRYPMLSRIVSLLDFSVGLDAD